MPHLSPLANENALIRYKTVNFWITGLKLLHKVGVYYENKGGSFAVSKIYKENAQN